MEHRCGQRRAVNMTILLRRRGWGGWLVGQLTDVSISGAFIRVAGGALPNLALVEIEASQPGGRRMLRSKALVVRSTPDGIGILFDELRPAGLAPLFDGQRPPVRAGTGGHRPFRPGAASSARA